jgi:hypothetical protein
MGLRLIKKQVLDIKSKYIGEGSFPSYVLTSFTNLGAIINV